MQTKLKKPVEQMDVEWGRISQRICSILLPVMQDKGYTKTTLAASIEYPQSSLSDVFSPEEKGRRRRWSIPLLLAVCKQLGLNFPDVMKAAWEGSSAAGLQLRLGNMPERSRERLGAILHAIAPGDASEEMRAMFYTINMLEAVVPDYVRTYLKGGIKDDQVIEDLTDCCERANGNFWGRVKAKLGKLPESHKPIKVVKGTRQQKEIGVRDETQKSE